MTESKLSLVEMIRRDLNSARRGDAAEKTLRVDALRTLVGELDGYAKSDKRLNNNPALKGQALTDLEALKIVEGAVASLDTAISQGVKLGRDTSKATAEQAILGVYLPQKMTEEDIEKEVCAFIASNPGAQLGQIMGYFKSKYAGRYDGSLVSAKAKQALS